MKKTFRFSLFMGVLAMMLTATMTSCGDDKDEPTPGGGTEQEKPAEPTAKHEMVDLGLPSGTKWATCNVGATNPEEFGNYYAQGETKPKNVFTWETYFGLGKANFKPCTDYDPLTPFIQSATTFAGTEYDVAHVAWGEKWTMPTKDQFEELLTQCTFKWELNYNNTNTVGYVVKGKNGKSIFLPAAGFRIDHKGDNFDIACYYWSAHVTIIGGNTNTYNGCCYMGMGELTAENRDKFKLDPQTRYLGFSVRPVSK